MVTPRPQLLWTTFANSTLRSPTAPGVDAPRSFAQTAPDHPLTGATETLLTGVEWIASRTPQSSLTWRVVRS